MGLFEPVVFENSLNGLSEKAHHLFDSHKVRESCRILGLTPSQRAAWVFDWTGAVMR